MKKHVSLLLVFAMIFALAGCSQQTANKTTTATQTEAVTTVTTEGTESTTEVQTETETEKPVVYTTLFPVYSLTQSIGGDLIDLRLAMPAGSDPHDYEPSAKMLAELSDASILIYNGLGIEAWVHSAEDTLTDAGVALVEASYGVELIDFSAEHCHEHHNCDDEAAEDGHEHNCDDEVAEDGHEHNCDDEAAEDGHEHNCDDEAAEDEHEHEHNHGDKDPHIWQSPKNAIVMAENIYSALLKEVVSEDDLAKLEANYNMLIEDLNILNQELEVAYSSAQRKEIVVGHAAFGYLADNYGLVQIPIAGLSTLDEPSPAILADISDFAKDHGVTTIFYDSLGSDKLAKVIAEETGVQLKPLHTLGMVSQEILDAGTTYADLMRENLESIKVALNE